MDQTHIGYSTWQQPDHDIMPAVQTVSVPAQGATGFAIEGDARAWPQPHADAVLPELSPFGAPSRSIDVFATGQTAPNVSVHAPSWLRVQPNVSPTGDVRYDVSVDWDRAPRGRTRAAIQFRPAGTGAVTIYANVFNPNTNVGRFVEAGGVVAMEAASGRNVDGRGMAWQEIEHLGRSGEGVVAFPVTALAQAPGGDDARIEFPTTWFAGGPVQVRVELAPTQAFNGTGLRYAISIDDEAPQIVNVHAGANGRVAHSGEHDDAWESWVANEVIASTTPHILRAAGQHVVKLWFVDPGLVFERVIVSRGPLPQSYLGPPENDPTVLVSASRPAH